jgi:hypothetical protein
MSSNTDIIAVSNDGMADGSTALPKSTMSHLRAHEIGWRLVLQHLESFVASWLAVQTVFAIAMQKQFGAVPALWLPIVVSAAVLWRLSKRGHVGESIILPGVLSRLSTLCLLLSRNVPVVVNYAERTLTYTSTTQIDIGYEASCVLSY